jgi:hypothetical protein
MHSGRIRLKTTDLKMSDPPEVIGRGGMGEIYKGIYREKVVAVKRSEVYNSFHISLLMTFDNAEHNSIAALHSSNVPL